jgi:hypothetical protein
MTFPREYGILLALLVVFALVFGGLSHAFVPHKHSHGAGESGFWSALHAALRSEEKKAIASLVGVFALFAVAMAAAPLFVPVFARASLRRKPDRLSRLLEKGVLSYRRFR